MLTFAPLSRETAMPQRLKWSELADMTPEEVTTELAAVVRVAREAPGRGFPALNARITRFAQRYDLSSEAMQKRPASGDLRETAEIAADPHRESSAMPFPPVAVVCLADARLRGLSALLLRHAGYRIIEVATVEEAKSALESSEASMLVTGEIADPEDLLTPIASDRGIERVRLGPDVRIEVLLEMFERIQ